MLSKIPSSKLKKTKKKQCFIRRGHLVVYFMHGSLCTHLDCMINCHHNKTVYACRYLFMVRSKTAQKTFLQVRSELSGCKNMEGH